MPKAGWVIAGVAAAFVAFVAWVLGGASHGTTMAAVSDVMLVALTVPVIGSSHWRLEPRRGGYAWRGWR